MLQLSLLQSSSADGLPAVVEALAARAVSAGVSTSLAEFAAGETIRRFSAASLPERDVARRGREYFRAIVRRRLSGTCSRGDEVARWRLLAESVAADLRSAGWSSDRIDAEVRRTLGDPPERRGAA